MYNVRLASFTDGSITFNAVASGVHVKDGPVDGPAVVSRIEFNDAGAIIDMDGTSPATLVPPLITVNLIFVAADPYAQTQYQNLIALKGHHGTSVWRIPNATTYVTKTADARLMDVRGTWVGLHKAGTENRIVLTADFQLKEFF